MPTPPIVLHPDGDEEVARMTAVSRQRRQRHTNTRGPTVRQSQPSTSLPLQDTDVLRSQLWSAHTPMLTHTHTKLAANVHTLAPAQSDDLAAALHYSTTTIVFVLLSSVGIAANQEKKRTRTETRKRATQKFVAAVLHGIHQKGVRHSMSGRRTRLMWSSFKRGHLSAQDPCRAMPKWMYRKRGKTIQPFVLKSWWEGKVASEFGVCWSVCFLF